MVRNLFVFSGIAFALFFSSCTKEHGSAAVNTTQTGPLFTAVRSVIQANCAVSGCHTNPNPQNGINFSDDNVIVAQKDRIKVRAVDKAGAPDQMPQVPRPALSAADQKKITDWITAGGAISN
ncbi:MAG: hypothetical protein ACJ749_09535 [Flavisolibacter sp.]